MCRGSISLPKIYFGTRSLERFEDGSVLTIGAFDGVHRGHQLIISRLRAKASESRLPSVAVTFYPDPLQYFNPDQAPPQIMSWREKAHTLLEAGVDAVVCLQFNEAIRTMAARTFAQEVLFERLGAQFVIVGDDFRFGAGRKGDFRLLQEVGAELGFETEQTATFEHNHERISSTRVRKLLRSGELDEAAKLLGRPYDVCGRVIRGHQLGRDLGFPTANIPLRRQRVAVSGVYAVRIKVGDRWFKGAANIGYRPAVNSLKRPLLEVHLLDFNDDLYGQRVRVRFEKKLRDEQNFGGLEELKAAIKNDVKEAREWFLKTSEIAGAENETENR